MDLMARRAARRAARKVTGATCAGQEMVREFRELIIKGVIGFFGSILIGLIFAIIKAL